MNAIGKVVKTEGKRAVVVSQRSSACASCHNCEAHGMCHAELVFGNQNEDVSVVAVNDACAKIGDTVVLETSTGKTLGVMLFIFVLPVVLTLVLYYLLNNVFVFGENYQPIILVLSFICLFFVSSFIANSYVNEHSSTHIVRVLEEC